MKVQKWFHVSAVVAALLLTGACKKEVSRSTGWEYNNSKNGGFEVRPFQDQGTGPGLVFIEGGTFTMGQTQDDVLY